MNKRISILAVILASVFVFASCKPKQSQYKSIYEAAKEKELDEVLAEDDDEIIVKKEKEAPAVKYPVAEEPVRREKVEAVDKSDAGRLKRYNVVIAAMGMKPNAESLKSKMVDEGYNPIIVQNEQGFYRVIIASFATREEAADAKNEILGKFMSQGDRTSLRSKYGIPFDDWWLLLRDY